MLGEAKHLSSKGRNAAEAAPNFRAALTAWYRENGRHSLPWRRTRDPYAILVSEFMLQQTQVATVLPYYKRWLARFPNVATLARASESEALHAWQGLGYYSRARNLHAAAQFIVEKHRGQFPGDVAEIRALPGAGRYTANAIATFAFGQSVPIIDANIGRVIARLFDSHDPIDSTRGREILWTNATRLLPQKGARDFNSALMDLGALVCIPRAPKCDVCPVREFCLATNPELLPRKKARPAFVELTEDHAFRFHRGRILLEQSLERWRGMWILPRLKISHENRAALHVAAFPFTHHRISLRVFHAGENCLTTNSQHRWFSRKELREIPMPSPHRRALTHLLDAKTQKLCSSFPRA